MTDPAHKPIAWITGAGGLIGSHLLRSAESLGSCWDVRGLTHAQLDLLDFKAVRQAFRTDSPALVVHCAALSSSNDCQRDPHLARRMNVEATATLAELAHGIPFIFFSTDLVFDGRKGNYVETDAVNPLNAYAETKVAAEEIVLANPKHTAIRAALNGGTSPKGDRGFNEQLRHAFQRSETLKLFTDEFRCPIPAAVTAKALWELVRQGKPGVYHLAGAERLSRLQIGHLIASRWPQLHPRIEPASAAGYHGHLRPADVSLNCAKIQKLLSFPLPRLSDWLAAHPQEAF